MMDDQGNDLKNRVTPRFTLVGKVLLLAEVIVFALLATLTAQYFNLNDAVSITLSMLVAYLIPRLVYSRSGMSCRWGQWWLLIVTALLALYAILSIKSCTVDAACSLENPRLYADDGRYYSWALSHYDGRCPEPKLAFKGLPMFMLFQWKLLGVSIVWPIAMNYMFTLLAIVMTGKMACRMLSHQFENYSPSTIAAVAMVIVSLMGFFMSQGVRLQKEAACSLGMVLVGYTLAGMAGIQDKKSRWRDIAIFVSGCLLLAMVRTNFTYFAIVGAAMMMLANHCTKWKYGALLVIISAVITVTFSILFSYSFGQQYRTIDGGDAMALAFNDIVQQPYFNIIGDYFHYPEWKRTLLLPLTAGIQYIIPFPWLYDYSHFSIFNMLPRLRWMWYFVGGVCIFYYLFINIIHHKNSNLGMWAWWPLVLFMIIAFITGGSVSRYILPLQPLFVVIALYVLLHVKQGTYRRPFILWMIVYIFILITLLVLCYDAQTEYLNNLNEYYRQKALQNLR